MSRTRGTIGFLVLGHLKTNWRSLPQVRGVLTPRGSCDLVNFNHDSALEIKQTTRSSPLASCVVHQCLLSDNSAEQIIKSSTRCEDSNSKTWQAIVEYTCSEEGEETAYFRGYSHCHVLLGVSSPLVCSRYGREVSSLLITNHYIISSFHSPQFHNRM